jgi:putative flippase GtrA
MASYAAIGIVSTAAYVAIYAPLRNVSSAAAANVAALVVTATANTAANCRLTFQVRGRDGLARHQAAALLALAVALAATSASLGVLDVVAPHRGRLTEIAVLLAANAAATLVRFLLLHLVIDPARSDRSPAERIPAFTTLSASEGARG